MKIYNCSDLSATENAARLLASNLMPGDIVRLHGEIGVGKTAFVRGVCSFFGCENEVSSPTFAIMNIYSGSLFPVYHFDLYRLESDDEVYDAGLYEFLEGSGASFVEWPDLLNDFPEKRIFDVYIEKDYSKGPDFRTIKIEGENF